MTDAAATTGTSPEPKRKKVDVWMIVAIVALVIALIAAYLAFTYKQQVDDWETAAAETVSVLQAAGVELRGTVESGVAGYEEQISDLSSALEQSQTEAGVSASQLAETEQALADAQAAQEDLQLELDAAQQQLDATEQDLAETQAALDDANAQLAQLGELVLPSGTYVGPVLGARTDPLPAIIFQQDTAWRVAEVSDAVVITVGDQTLTLEAFAALLQSAEPGAAELANADYEVVVKKGLVTSISSVEA